MKEIEPREFHEHNIPPALITAMIVLNQALAISQNAVSNIFSYYVPLFYKEEKELESHPSIILGEDDRGHPALGVLGLLNGVVGNEDYRLAMSVDDSGYPVLRFYIVTGPW